jgi:transposase
LRRYSVDHTIRADKRQTFFDDEVGRIYRVVVDSHRYGLLISFLELALRMNVANVASPSARDRLVGERTVLINQLRGILLERGIAFPQGRRKLAQYLAELLASGGGASLSQRTLTLIEDMRVQRRDLDVRIEAFDAEFVACARQGDDARRLATIPGIGVMNATAYRSDRRWA